MFRSERMDGVTDCVFTGRCADLFDIDRVREALIRLTSTF